MCANLSTCELYNSSDLIFIGKAVEIITEKEEKDAKGNWIKLGKESTVFEADEVIFGVKKKRFTVRNADGFGCDVEFEKGETYLIFANGDETKGFGTSLCHRNAPIAYAQEMLDHLRNLPSAGAGGILFGQVWDLVTQRYGDDRLGLPGIKIKIQEHKAGGKVYQTVSNFAGNFQINLPEGVYKLTPLVPDHAELETYSDTQNLVFVRDRGGCTRESFSVHNKSRISGKVVDSDGKPVSDVKVEFIPVNKKERNYMEGAETEAPDGSFSFENLPVGNYTLSVNFASSPDGGTPYPTTFYPNSRERSSAKVFEIGLGQKIDGIVFRLPPKLGGKEIRGSVFWEDGTPAAGVETYLMDDEFPGFYAGCYLKTVSETVSGNVVTATAEYFDCKRKTNSEGKFVLSGFENRKYTVNASFWKKIGDDNVQYAAKSAVFSMDDAQPEFKLILKIVEDTIDK